jgi:hypothetical protein
MNMSITLILYSPNDFGQIYMFIHRPFKLDIGGKHVVATMKMYVLRATSHTRLRTCDHCTSSTPIDGNGGASPSSLHTTYA